MSASGEHLDAWTGAPRPQPTDVSSAPSAVQGHPGNQRQEIFHPKTSPAQGRVPARQWDVPGEMLQAGHGPGSPPGASQPNSPCTSRIPVGARARSSDCQTSSKKCFPNPLACVHLKRASPRQVMRAPFSSCQGQEKRRECSQVHRTPAGPGSIDGEPGPAPGLTEPRGKSSQNRPPKRPPVRTLSVPAPGHAPSPRGSPPAAISRSPTKCTSFPSSPRAPPVEEGPGGSGVTRAGLWRRSARPGSSVPHSCLPAAGSRTAAENGARFCFLPGESPGLPGDTQRPARLLGKGQAGSERHGSGPKGAASPRVPWLRGCRTGQHRCHCVAGGAGRPRLRMAAGPGGESSGLGEEEGARSTWETEKLWIRASCNHPGHAGVTAKTFPR